MCVAIAKCGYEEINFAVSTISTSYIPPRVIVLFSQSSPPVIVDSIWVLNSDTMVGNIDWQRYN